MEIIYKNVTSMTDLILLRTPVRPENMLAIRLMVAGLANLCHFDSDAIEDMKLAVSEACFSAGHEKSVVDLVFILEEGKMAVEVKGPPWLKRLMLKLNDAAEEGIGLLLMRHLTDSMEFKAGENATFIRLERSQKSRVPAGKA